MDANNEHLYWGHMRLLLKPLALVCRRCKCEMLQVQHPPADTAIASLRPGKLLPMLRCVLLQSRLHVNAAIAGADNAGEH